MPRAKPPAPPVAVDAVLAWRLARHHLLERSEADAVTVASDILGVHAQIASAAELALAVRIDALRPGHVASLLERRKLVKTWAMRGTLHYFAARDMPLWVAAMRSRVPYERPVWQRGFNVTLAQMEKLMAAIHHALDGRALTREELDDEVVQRTDGSLRGRLRSGWGELLKPAAYQGLLCFGPPRGRNVTFVRPDQWVRGWRDSALTTEQALGQIARRYLHAYGPASREHFAAWWGCTPAEGGRVFRSIEDELTEVDLDGERVSALSSDLPGIRSAGLPRAHLRLLGHFDPYKVGVRPRRIFVPDEFYDRVYLKAGWMSPVVLQQGRAVGIWEAKKGPRQTTVTVAPFGSLSQATLKAVRAEAERLAPFLGGGTVEVSLA